MGNKNKLGIWMDYANAILIDLDKNEITQTIVSDFDFDTQTAALQRSENIMHNKERQMNESYYKEIGMEILKYDHVLLFGPTNARLELNNYLQDDSKFKEIQFDVQSADKMTDNEKVAFVRDHFKM